MAVSRTGATILHLDSDPEVIGANYPTEVGLVGDARLGLEALARALQARDLAETGFQGRARVAVARKEKWDALVSWPLRASSPFVRNA